MAKEIVNREELINEIWRTFGKPYHVAKRLGISVRTVYNYVDKYATVRDALESARLEWDARLLDKAETNLDKRLDRDDAWANRYVLDNKGYARGYMRRQEVVASGQVNVRVEYVNDWEDDHD